MLPSRVNTFLPILTLITLIARPQISLALRPSGAQQQYQSIKQQQQSHRFPPLHLPPNHAIMLPNKVPSITITASDRVRPPAPAGLSFPQQQQQQQQQPFNSQLNNEFCCPCSSCCACRIDMGEL